MKSCRVSIVLAVLLLVPLVYASEGTELTVAEQRVSFDCWLSEKIHSVIIDLEHDSGSQAKKPVIELSEWFCTEHKAGTFLDMLVEQFNRHNTALWEFVLEQVEPWWNLITDQFKVALRTINLNRGDKYHKTALHKAAGRGHVHLVKLLIALGVPQSAGCQQMTPLHFAAENGRDAVVEVLLSEGAVVDAQDVFGWTPLHHAVRHGRDKVVAQLLDMGADWDVCDCWKKTPLDLAREHGKHVCFRLIEEKIKQEAEDNRVASKRRAACDQWLAERVKLLAERYAQQHDQPFAADEAEGVLKWVPQELLDWGAANHVMGELLELVVARADLLEFILAHTEPTEGTDTLLVQLMKFLMEYDVQKNIAPLHYAAEHGHVHSARALLAAGAPVNGPDRYKWTPLLQASLNNKPEVVKVLLQAGADTTATNKQGQTALDMAERYQHRGCTALLRAASTSPQIALHVLATRSGSFYERVSQEALQRAYPGAKRKAADITPERS